MAIERGRDTPDAAISIGPLRQLFRVVFLDPTRRIGHDRVNRVLRQQAQPRDCRRRRRDPRRAVHHRRHLLQKRSPRSPVNRRQGNRGLSLRLFVRTLFLPRWSFCQGSACQAQFQTRASSPFHGFEGRFAQGRKTMACISQTSQILPLFVDIRRPIFSEQHHRRSIRRPRSVDGFPREASVGCPGRCSC